MQLGRNKIRWLVVAIWVALGIWFAETLGKETSLRAISVISGIFFAIVLASLFPARNSEPRPSGYHFNFDDTVVGKFFAAGILILFSVYLVLRFDSFEPFVGGMWIGFIIALAVPFIRNLFNGNTNERPS
jgi:hypothetical protein